MSLKDRIAKLESKSSGQSLLIIINGGMPGLTRLTPRSRRPKRKCAPARLKPSVVGCAHSRGCVIAMAHGTAWNGLAVWLAAAVAFVLFMVLAK